ncbi:MAG: hypothetical protein R3E12_10075 [Candidatus Eisenbacteria bacterium]
MLRRASIALATLLGPLAALVSLHSPIRADWQPAQADVNEGRLRAMGVAPTNPDVIYISTSTLGLYRTDDAGATWTDVTSSLSSGQAIYAAAVSPVSAEVVLLGATGRVLRSTDGGDRWLPITDGLNRGVVSRLLFDPFDADVVFASVAGASGGVYRSLDGGFTWSWVTSSFGSLGLRDLVLDPSDPSRLVAALSTGHLRSTDAGNSWQLFDTAGVELWHLAWSPVDPDLVWASGYDTVNEWVYRAPTGGRPSRRGAIRRWAMRWMRSSRTRSMRIA